VEPWQAVEIFLAGGAAGTINTLVGSGTLVTFPVLLAVGIPPVTANVSNNIGLVPGSVSGAWGYRHELAGQRIRVAHLATASLVGGFLGAAAVIVLPSGAFDAIVPILVSLGLLVMAFGPRLVRRAAARRTDSHVNDGPPRWLWAAVGLTAVYGGYFGAAQGVLLMAVLNLAFADGLQRLNAAKNILVALVNGIAGAVFIVAFDVDWTVVLLIGLGAVGGGQVGARLGRRLPEAVLRIVVIAVGATALVVFLLR